MNKNFTQTLLIAAAMIGFSMSASAQEATGSVVTNAEVITPISIIGNTPLEFGSIVATAAGGTVTISTGGVRSSTATPELIPSTKTPTTAAQFTVSGQNGYTYSLITPDNTTGYTISNGTATMLVKNFTVSNLGNGTLSGAGDQVVTIGADLIVTGGQASGAYTTAVGEGLIVTVQYN